MIDQPNLREEQLDTPEAPPSESESIDTPIGESVPESVIGAESSASEEENATVSGEKADTPLPQPTAEEVMAALSQEVTSLQEQLENERQQAETFKTRHISLAAEFDNFRKRTQKEKQELEVLAKCKALREILAVVDNFERARTQIKPNNEGEALIHNSYQGVYKSLVDSLKRLGVSAMNPIGEPFDPLYHEAMLQEATNEYPEGTVVEQLVRGYLLGDQVLRHAMVKVSVPKEEDSSSSDPESLSSETADASAN